MAAPPTEAQHAITPGDLPDGFVLGVATSAPQIEGAATADGRGRSIWDAFALQSGAIVDGSSPADACDHYRRVEADLDLLADLGVDSYRFSVAWPRIQPTGRGRPLEAGLDFYDRLVDGLLERGIQPNVTLYHWDLPAVLEDDLGGWRHRDTAGRFADYALAVAERLADRVAWWSTLNEPWCSAFLGYERGVHAPGVRDEVGAVRAAHHLLVGHGLAVQALRSVGAQQVGIVLNLNDVRPATDRPGDVEAAERMDGTQNRWWLGALAGDVPDDVLEHSIAPFVALEDLSREGDAALAATPIDWLGINTYFPEVVAAGDDDDLRPAGPGLDGIVAVPAARDEPTNMLGWRIDAQRAAAVLHQAHGFLPELPIMITENGIPLPDVEEAGLVDDPARIAYLTDHLAAVLATRDDGVPVQGYYAWSLLDNFEWAQGYAPRFGLVHVDFATQERTPKRSFHWLRELARGR